MNIINKIFNAATSLGEDIDGYDDEYLDDEYLDDEFDDEYGETKSNKINFFAKSKKPSFNNAYEEEVKAEPVAPRKTPGSDVRVMKPTSVDDGRVICEALLAGSTVILNVEGIDLEIAQRIIDFTSGATYSINGNLQKISSAIFVVTPVSVDITGDLQDILAGSFDVSSIRNRY